MRRGSFLWLLVTAGCAGAQTESATAPAATESRSDGCATVVTDSEAPATPPEVIAKLEAFNEGTSSLELREDEAQAEPQSAEVAPCGVSGEYVRKGVWLAVVANTKYSYQFIGTVRFFDSAGKKIAERRIGTCHRMPNMTLCTLSGEQGTALKLGDPATVVGRAEISWKCWKD